MIRNVLIVLLVELAERRWISDGLVRSGIRYLCKQRLEKLHTSEKSYSLNEFISRMEVGAIAALTESANEQHYEIPTEFFELALGSRKKYSCCLYHDTECLDKAENDALRVTCERAEIENGMSILELGCGWGSLTLWMAEHFPNSNITAVSNSKSQREFILAQARRRGIGKNLTVVTADINDFEASEVFDRVISVEMFEHVRNHKALFYKISKWLNPHGKLFVHIFCNKNYAYSFEKEDASSWMSRYFFSGGIMPSEELFSRYNDNLSIQRTWTWNGKHYEKTSNAWLRNLDLNHSRALEVLGQVYGNAHAERWLNRWRIFFMACAELFGWGDGDQWYVAHYLFSPRKAMSLSAANSEFGEASYCRSMSN